MIKSGSRRKPVNPVLIGSKRQLPDLVNTPDCAAEPTAKMLSIVDPVILVNTQPLEYWLYVFWYCAFLVISHGATSPVHECEITCRQQRQRCFCWEVFFITKWL